MTDEEFQVRFKAVMGDYVGHIFEQGLPSNAVGLHSWSVHVRSNLANLDNNMLDYILDDSRLANRGGWSKDVVAEALWILSERVLLE